VAIVHGKHLAGDGAAVAFAVNEFGYHYADDGLQAARAGQGIVRWADELVPDAAEIVITTAMAATLTYNLSAGERVMVTQYTFAVETTSDDCSFTFGYTDAADGGGNFTQMAAHRHIYTGAANDGYTTHTRDIYPPEPITYSSGARCITFRVDANDAACTITVGWHGWSEHE
jgi:hypothetical protein